MNLHDSRSLLLVLITLCLSYSVRAAPVDDVRRGSSIQITQFGFSLNGDFEAGNVFLAKEPNTLDATLDARMLGIGVDLRVPLRGTSSGDTITWSFDLSPTPAIEIGWPNSIVRIHGSLRVRAEALPGDADPRCAGVPCPYTVRLSGLPESEVTVTINTFLTRSEHRAQNIRLAGFGGLPRPRLQQFVVNVPSSRFCSRSIQTYISGRATIAMSAPSGGTWVSISSSDPARVRVAGVTIPEGEQSAAVPISVAPDWSGGVALTASAGGLSQTVALNVLPRSACSVMTSFSIADLSSCLFCFHAFLLNNSGDALGELDGKQVFFWRDWKGPRPLAEVFLLGTQAISPLTLNNQGQLIGAFSGQAERKAFFADLGFEAKPRELLTFDNAELTAANDFGIVVGTHWLNNRPTAFYFNGKDRVDLPVKAEWSAAVAVNNREEIAGNLNDGKQSHAFVFYNKEVQLVGDLGLGNSTATALSEIGHVVGYSQGADKTRGFIAERGANGSWQVKDLGDLPDFTEIRPTAVNASGVVVGTASTKQGQGLTTAFLYSPQTGLVDLNKLVKSEARIVSALTINDANEIVVVGDLKGEKVSFILRPNGQ
jgi:probable HAF family extracellular repeat protein